jgi:hypothetical protein
MKLRLKKKVKWFSWKTKLITLILKKNY